MKIKAKPEKSNADWERDWKRTEAQRQRVVRAFLALRALKTLAPYPEPAIRHMRLDLLNLPWRLADQMEFEEVDTIRKLLTIEMWRILDEFDGRLTAGDSAPHTPLHARYVTADGQLLQGDLELP